MLTWSGPGDPPHPPFQLSPFISMNPELLSSPGSVCGVVVLEQFSRVGWSLSLEVQVQVN